MRHVTAGDKSFLLGDLATERLFRYTALLLEAQSADTLDLEALELVGRPTTVSILLSAGLSLVAETVETVWAEPANPKAEEYLGSAIDRILARRYPALEDLAGTDVWGLEDPSDS